MTDETPEYSPTKPVTWKLLTILEPGLEALEHLLTAVQKMPGTVFCANQVWYRGAKPLLLPLVGFERGYIEPAEDPNDTELKALTFTEFTEDRSIRWSAETAWEENLRSSEAYDVAYEHLHGLLPYCDPGCGCA